MSIVTASELTPAPATPALASVEDGIIWQVEEFDMMDVIDKFTPTIKESRVVRSFEEWKGRRKEWGCSREMEAVHCVTA